MSVEQLQILIEKYLDESLLPEEHRRLALLLQEPGNVAAFESMIVQGLHDRRYELDPDNRVGDSIKQYVKSSLAQTTTVERDLDRSIPPSIPAHPIHFRKTSWFRYVAAVIVLLGAATMAIIVNSDRQYNRSGTGVSGNISDANIQPGSNRAVLTVDNKKIDLSSDKTGITVGNAITYSDGEKLSDAGQMLTLTTPRGGQYRAVLPDGSQVWLNAASSIKFPSKFNGSRRLVEVTGEVYMEIAKNTKQPFSVHLNGARIEVLGTSFNVKAYGDEGEIETTLVDGSVKVSPIPAIAVAPLSRQGEMDANQSFEISGTKAVVLKPGQQAVVNKGHSVQDPESVRVQAANLDQVLAWKNGIFNVDGQTFASVMENIERWYDVTVVYEGPPPTFKLKGRMDRGVKLSGLIHFMEGFGLRVRLEGRKLIVKEQKN